MMHLLRILCLLTVCFSMSCFGQEVRRTLISFYDSSLQSQDGRYNIVHTLLEMPMNHLGYIIKHHDLQSSLPDINAFDNVAGIILTPEYSDLFSDVKFLSFVEKVLSHKIKLFLYGNFSTIDSENLKFIKNIYSHIGLDYKDQWIKLTYLSELDRKNTDLVDFERTYSGILPGYPIITANSMQTQTYLVAKNSSHYDSNSILISSHPNGGYIASGYLFYSQKDKYRQFYINPFTYFNKVWHAFDVPKPDTTTLTGRRIYYSHVDGDGWNNITHIQPYSKNKTLSSEVIFKEVILKYPQLPVTVAPVAGDLDIEWHGTDQSIQVAKNIFIQPHVEAGSHTYSHPFDWYFFKDNPEKEFTLLSKYKKVNIQSYPKDFNTHNHKNISHKHNTPSSRYEKPRAYAVYPFNLEKEINGSIDFINTLLPKNKKVNIIQWSGDTTPYQEAIALSRSAGVRNINGGDTRFDREFASYSWVSSVGRYVKNVWQVYASNSNENTYTDLWTDRFFGFQFLIKTIQNTNTPIRLKPINVYYHMYSGERQSSMNALIKNIEYALTQKIHPIATSHYAGISDGFFAVKMIELSHHQWKILNRDQLQTLRFDHSASKTVDYPRSNGVIGHHYLQGSLYVSLDPSVAEPIVAIKKHDMQPLYEITSKPYLIDSTWMTRNVSHSEKGFLFNTQGFGEGTMTWRTQPLTHYQITTYDSGQILQQQVVKTDSTGLLVFTFPQMTQTQLQVEAIQL